MTYTVTLTNSGGGAQADNAGNEFTDILPASLTLVSATATSGTAAANVGTNTVTWNGALAARRLGDHHHHRHHQRRRHRHDVSNQGTISYDADGNGTNECDRRHRRSGHRGRQRPDLVRRDGGAVRHRHQDRDRHPRSKARTSPTP